VTLAKCTLRGELTSTRFDSGRNASGAFLSAAGTLDAHQTCTIPVEGGDATITLDQGTVSWDNPTTVQIVFSGRIVKWHGSSPRAGYLTYTFKGAEGHAPDDAPPPVQVLAP
jgi:hypothetical protein